jgi:outer membrane lipoprotein-sorting protein
MNKNLTVEIMKIFLLPVLLILWVLPAASQDDPNTILSKMDQVMFSPKDRSGNLTMILVDKDGSEKIREATFLQKGTDKKTLPLHQTRIAGRNCLTFAAGRCNVVVHACFGTAQKKYPSYREAQAFTGTDFAYEDMALSSYSERFTPSIQSTGANDYVLELNPKSNKSIYSKILVRVDKTNGYPIWMKYYNAQGRMFKEATYTYEKVGKYWNASEVVMKDLEKNHSTIVRMKNVKFDQGLSDDIFTVEKMKKVGLRSNQFDEVDHKSL